MKGFLSGQPLELPWMWSISCPLVFIQDYLHVWIHISWTVYPHKALGTGCSAVFVYKHRSLICLDYMKSIKLHMKIIVHYSINTDNKIITLAHIGRIILINEKFKRKINITSKKTLQPMYLQIPWKNLYNHNNPVVQVVWF